MSQDVDDRITRDDIKSKLGDLQGEAQHQVEGAKNQLLMVGAGVAIVVLVVTFMLGRRAGKRASAVIEVRRS